MRQRIQWIDYARGLAIFGVVMWHVVGGVVGDGVTVTPGMVAFGDIWDLYTFRLMPIFFFVSGAFFVRSLSRPFMQVVVNKAKTIAYPYALWTIISLIVGTIVGFLGVEAENLSQVPRLFYDPISHYWFLYALMVIMLLTYVAYTFKINRWLIVAFGLLIFILSAATVFYNIWYVVGQIGYFFIFFMAGVWVGSDFIKRVNETPLMIHIAMFIIGAIALYFMPIRELNRVALDWQPLASTIAMIMTINLAVILEQVKFASFVRQWGLLSMEIYLVHVLAIKSFRVLTFNILGLDNAWFHIITGILIGLYVPILLKWLSDKVGTNILFVAPDFKKQETEATSVTAGTD